MKKWAGLLLAFLLLLGATASAAVQIGDRAEDFSIVNSDGTVSTLSPMLAQKKAVYVYFWASWRDMSREELPVVINTERIAASSSPAWRRRTPFQPLRRSSRRSA